MANSYARLEWPSDIAGGRLLSAKTHGRGVLFQYRTAQVWNCSARACPLPALRMNFNDVLFAKDELNHYGPCPFNEQICPVFRPKNVCFVSQMNDRTLRPVATTHTYWFNVLCLCRSAFYCGHSTCYNCILSIVLIKIYLSINQSIYLHKFLVDSHRRALPSVIALYFCAIRRGNNF